MTAASDGNILILGASSWVGQRLMRAFGDRAVGTCNKTLVPGCLRFDALTNRLRDHVAKGRFSHAAVLLADSQPDSCFADPVQSRALNVTAVERTIEDCFVLGITPIFASTEFVFDGTTGNYTESDAPNPVLLYGQQKLEVESWLRASGQPHIVFRFAKVYGTEPGDGSIFSAWLASLLRGEPRIRCASDQVFSPVFVGDICSAIGDAVDLGLTGLFHLSGGQRFSRIELLHMLIRELSKHRAVEVSVEPCSIHGFNLPERRPIDVSMRNDALVAATGRRASPIEDKCAELVHSALS